MTSEEYSPYLKKCYSAFKNAQDILVTMGVSFSSSDMHIVKAIKSNHNLKKVYIGYYKNKELQAVNLEKDRTFKVKSDNSLDSSTPIGTNINFTSIS